MGIQYRAIHRSEVPAALRLWHEVFEVEEWYFRSTLDAEPTRKLYQTLAAFEDDGTMVAAVHFFVRPTRRPDGVPERMGAIGNVATIERARRQGHSTRLLDMAIQNMRREGCVWSMLMTGVNHHYERLGWKTVPTRYRVGSVAQRPCASLEGVEVRRHDPLEEPRCWEPFQAIHRVYNRVRPLTHVRPNVYWPLVVQPRLQRPPKAVWSARSVGSSEPSAYLVAQIGDEEATVLELCWMPNGRECTGALLESFRAEVAAKGVQRVRLHLPDDPVLEPRLRDAFPGLETQTADHVMVRPIGDGVSMEELEERFRLPGAHHWPLNDF
ncbi:MAG: GNAT family N-acetyltransferase [Fimbriimonadales bacterium]